MKIVWEAGCKFSLDLTEDEDYRIEEGWVVTELDKARPWHKGKPQSCWPRGHFWLGWDFEDDR